MEVKATAGSDTLRVCDKDSILNHWAQHHSKIIQSVKAGGVTHRLHRIAVVPAPSPNAARMGLAPSAEEKDEFRRAVGAHIYEAMLESGALPDVGIDRRLLDGPGLQSGQAARDQFRELRKHVDAKAPAYLKELMGKLAAFTDEPKVTGLLTLVVSVAIETAFASSRRPPPPPQGVAPEERLSELRDLAEEYLKRTRMHLGDDRKLREDTERLEGQVSFLLTQIKNAMLADGHANSRTLKHWVNGAAFHVQMLIHLARLGRLSEGPARAAIASYQEDLRELLPAYRKYKASTVRVSKRTEPRLADDGLQRALAGYSVRDREVGKSTDVPLPEDTPLACEHLDSAFCAQAYLDHMFSNYHHITDMEAYFSDTLSNLPALITQT
ncbi:hypothetical protein SKAU_G00181260 [Synaphobranchus kaupii]|uniref:Uncharacterized protein n=1 Tax=Synaphobranchus kaupii TaxID=118154 RepID=A0A9Q1FMI5_SYNKA|nr:hypothetical protein SKAU_G00181260 [Synaphobranchus kaupii]